MRIISTAWADLAEDDNLQNMQEVPVQLVDDFQVVLSKSQKQNLKKQIKGASPVQNLRKPPWGQL